MRKALLFLMLLTVPVFSQVAVGPLINSHPQFLDASGNPLSGGKIYTYSAGTSTPLATYSESTGTSANSNPIILDSGGYANIWLGPNSYKIIVKTSADVTLYTADGITSLSNLLNVAYLNKSLTFTSKQTMSGGVTGLPTPSVNSDAATKKYVDDAVAIPSGAASTAYVDQRTKNSTNVTANSYGFALVADGTTDNCSNFNSLVTAVPAGTVLYFPPAASKYHFVGTCSSSNGLVMTKRLGIVGGGRGYWDGTTFQGGTLIDAPIALNLNPGSFVSDLAIDISSQSTYVDCISSGAAQAGTSMNMAVSNVNCKGRGSANPGHGVLMQSGPRNTIENISVYQMYHCWAVRSPLTTVNRTYCEDNTDAIVKSDTGSGPVDDVNVSNVICYGSAATKGCGMFVTANAGTITTYNVNINNVTFNNSSYGFVINVENGGIVQGINVSNLTGFFGTQALYSFTGSTGTCQNINVTSSQFISFTTGYTNSASCTNFNAASTRVNGTTVSAYDAATYSVLGTGGLTATKTVKGSAGANCDLVFSSGILLSTTCP